MLVRDICPYAVIFHMLLESDELQCLMHCGTPTWDGTRDAGVQFRNHPDPELHRTAPQVRSGSRFRCKNVLIFGWGAVRGAAYVVHLMHPVQTGLHPKPVKVVNYTDNI